MTISLENRSNTVFPDWVLLAEIAAILEDDGQHARNCFLAFYRGFILVVFFGLKWNLSFQSFFHISQFMPIAIEYAI